MFHRFLSLVLIIPLICCDCYNYLQGDTYFPPSILSSSYCASIIRWPISDNTIANYTASDITAQSLYSILYQRYKLDPEEVNIDCMGIAKYVFCAYAYPTCIPANTYGVKSNDTSDKMNVCQWLCDLWMVRCPTQFDLYGQICGSQRGDTCSYGWRWGMMMGIVIGAMMMVL